MIRLLNMKNYMKKLHPDIIIQIMFQLLIINYFRTNQVDTYVEEIGIKNSSSFLETSITFLSNSVKNKLDLESLLTFLNYLFDLINLLQEIE